MQLSKHFTLEEFTTTQHRGIDNSAPDGMVHQLAETAARLEVVRELLGTPMHINSAYRCLALNNEIGSKPTSGHVKGYAVDFISPGYGSPLHICHAIQASKIKYDQLIEEGSWVHISFDPRMRMEVLTMRNGKYTVGLRKE